MLLAAGAAAPPLGPRVHRLVVQQSVLTSYTIIQRKITNILFESHLVTSLEVAAGVVTSKQGKYGYLCLR